MSKVSKILRVLDWVFIAILFGGAIVMLWAGEVEYFAICALTAILTHQKIRIERLERGE